MGSAVGRVQLGLRPDLPAGGTAVSSAGIDRTGTAQPSGMDRAAGGGRITNITGALNLLRSLQSSTLAMRGQTLTLIPQIFLLPSNTILVRTVITVINQTRRI